MTATMHLLPPVRGEPERLRVLESLDVVGSDAGPVLEGLVRCAAALCGSPIAFVGLIDADGMRTYARLGIDLREIPLDFAPYAHATHGTAPLVVVDASKDVRFAANPLVIGESHMRFFACIPLSVDGQCIGTLCVIDRRAREIEPATIDRLRDLARAAEQSLLGRRQQRDLREVANYRRNLFDQLGDGVLLLDRNYRVLDANPSALDMLGYRQVELPKLRLHDLLSEDERQRLGTVTARSLGDAPALSEWQALRKDGSRFAAEVSVRPVDGARYVAVVRDVTERHTQAQQLRELSAAVEQAAEGIVITDLNGRIEYVNAAAVTRSGYSRDELVGQSPRLLRSERTPEATFRGMWSNLRAGRPWKGLMFNRSKTGRESIVFAVVTPIRQPSGEVTQYLAVLEDVTEKRRMGEELDRYRHHLEDLVAQRTAELEQARQTAEAASIAKSSFLASMSHEIRTPMNGVVGIVDVLRRSSLTPHQAELADTIRESSFALLGIIDDILDFSKAEAGALGLDCAPVDLLRLVEGTCDALQPLAASRGVELQSYVDPALPPWIESDALRLRQIMNNLLGNAIKFASGLDRVGRVQLRCEPAGAEALRLQVIDNGIGVAVEARAQIFEPFVQGDRSTARRYGGTGLGLSICRRLVDLFGGTIEIGSGEGPGACFTVRLPLSRAEGPTPSTPDLRGVGCHLCLRDPRRARDWCAYLAAAGATATAWSDVASMLDGLETRAARRPVLVVEGEDHAALDDGGATGDGARAWSLVRVGHGQRRQARLIGPDRVTLDAAALHRDALLQAVALAAGVAVAEPTEDAVHDGGAPGSVDAEQAARQGRLILVAEDNDINQTVLLHQLAALGFAAEVVGDGAEALARWRRHREAPRYGLLLTDVNMPVMDGYALATAIRAEENEHERLPIVALTANALADEAARCLAIGMDSYVSKPVDLKRLGEMVAQWLPPATEAAAESDALQAKASVPMAGQNTDAHVLLVDDDAADLRTLERKLRILGATAVTACTSARGALEWLEAHDSSATLVLLDLNMPAMDGVEFMRHLADRHFAGAVALVSAADRRVLETATKLAEAYRLNVLSHMHKPVPGDTLRLLIDRWRGFVPQRAGALLRQRSGEEIHQAIVNNELTLHYQPKVSLASGALVGVEALVRWQHPKDGLCYPDSFVAGAEVDGQIEALTRTVLRLALGQQHRWREAGLAVKLAVNVSMDNLARLDFPEFVLAEAQRHGVEPTDIVLEVTESRLMRDARSTMDILTRLRLKRIGLSIDDFGTGHSSLAQLRDIPFDELKIDRGFVHGSREHPTQRAIFAASVDMAHQLGMSAVAEGVEDRADWDFVRAAGCDVAQGYFIARPMPAAALPDWAAQWAERFEAL